MSNTLWKEVPGFPGYFINRSGWVRNARGYIVASGQSAMLSQDGKRVYLTRKKLLALAAEAFGEAPAAPAPEVPAAPAETIQDAAPAPVPVPAPAPDAREEAVTPAPRPERESARSREKAYLQPRRELPLRDPWADGRIERQSEWDWAGVM